MAEDEALQKRQKGLTLRISGQAQTQSKS